jgi:TatD DNase family protein
MQLIDTHCHLYGESFTNDIAEVISRAEAEGVSRFFLPAIDTETHQAMLDLETRFPGQCIAMMGCHLFYRPQRKRP